LAAGVVALALLAQCRSKADDLPSGRAQPEQVGALSQAARTTDKGFPGHGYTEMYERFLWQWKNEPIRIFEIGIAGGGSIAMWLEYFPRASIYGVDINDSSRFEQARVKTCIADQANRAQLKKCLDAFGGQFDLLVDDGGHSMEQQQVSLGFLFPYVRPGGFYSIEDLHTSLPNVYPDFGVEPDESNSTVNMIFNYIKSAPGVITSKYIRPEEKKDLDANIESTSFHFSNNQGHSMMCLFKKWVPNVAGHFVPGTPGNAITTTTTQAETASDSATSTAR
jgi:hypothetical protein